MIKACVLGIMVVTLALTLSACEDEQVTLRENVEQMRRDPQLQQNLQDWRDLYEDCVERGGKIFCLNHFLETQEEDLDACLAVFDSSRDDKNLCSLNLEVAAADRGWSIPDVGRTAGLLSDPDARSFHAECVSEVDEFNCFSRLVLYHENFFDICDDIWGEGDCEQVLGELKAALNISLDEGRYPQEALQQ